MSIQPYRISNWSKHNKALVTCGRMTLWFDDKSIKSWDYTEKKGKQGRPCTYSGTVIICLLLIKTVFKMDFWKLQGFVESLVEMMGLDMVIPLSLYMSL